jgi:hypothetical protein
MGEVGGNITRFVMNLSGGRPKFITSPVTNLGPPVAIRQIEEAEIPEVRDRETAPEAPGERTRERLQHGLPVLGAQLATLHALYDLPPDVPVGEDHLAVHRSDDARAGVLQDGDDPLEEGVGLERGDGRDGGGEERGARLRVGFFTSTSWRADVFLSPTLSGSVLKSSARFTPDHSRYFRRRSARSSSGGMLAIRRSLPTSAIITLSSGTGAGSICTR